MEHLSPQSESSEKKPSAPRRASFFGTAFHKISERNQVAIPRHMLKTALESAEGPLLLMRVSQESFLRLYTQKQLDAKIDEVRARVDLDPKVRTALVRGLSSNVSPVEPDTQGRFVLPAKWVDEIGLREEVAFCGAFNWIEIWPAQARRDLEKQEHARSADTTALIAEIMDS